MQAGDMPQIHVPTQFGLLTVVEDDGTIVRVSWANDPEPGADDAASPLLSEAAAQLVAYDQGRLTRFDLPLRVDAPPFQQAVCQAMSDIPYGETRTYGDIARALGHPAQAVGQACGRNPIPVIIPCHRVMGANNRLVGFSGGEGVETKVALLRHENAGSFLI